MSHAFVAPGSSRANRQQHNNMVVSTEALKSYQSLANFFNGFQPQLNQGYSDLFTMASNPNLQATVDAMRRKSMMSGQQAAHTAMGLFGNGSLAQGAGIDAMNKGMDTANQFMAQQMSPEEQMKRLLMALQGAQQPFSNMLQLGGLIHGQPQVPVGKSGLDYLMNAAQIAGGLGWQPFGRAAGGGGGGGGGGSQTDGNGTGTTWQGTLIV